jgi:Exo-beta-D-glucosaminidase Ig-fold domain
MPSYWSSNYFSLAPGEKISQTVSCRKALILKKPHLKVEGWNVSML